VQTPDSQSRSVAQSYDVAHAPPALLIGAGPVQALGAGEVTFAQ
jgi:hypothetical protein